MTERIDRMAQLRDEVRTQGGRWDHRRALSFYHSVGFPCEWTRARENLRRLALESPDLLVPVEGERWVYDSVPTPESPTPDLAQYSITPTCWGLAAFDVLCLHCRTHDWGHKEVAGWVADGGEIVTLAEVMAAIQAHHDARHREDASPAT